MGEIIPLYTNQVQDHGREKSGDIIYASYNFQRIKSFISHPVVTDILCLFCEQELGLIDIRKDIEQSGDRSQFLEDFYDKILGRKEGLQEFLLFLHKAFTEHEEIYSDICNTLGEDTFAETLCILFSSALDLSKDIYRRVGDVFSQKVIHVLDKVNSYSQVPNFETSERLGITIKRGFSPISESGELVLFMHELQVANAKMCECVLFPSGKHAKIYRDGSISWVQDGEGTISEEAQFWENIEHVDTIGVSFSQNISKEEYKAYKKWHQFHIGEGIILTEQEYLDYTVEFEVWSSTQTEAITNDDITSEDLRYLQAGFAQYLSSHIQDYEKISGAKRKRHLHIVG